MFKIGNSRPVAAEVILSTREPLREVEDELIYLYQALLRVGLYQRKKLPKFLRLEKRMVETRRWFREGK